MKAKIEAELSPSFLDIQNESHMHSVPRKSETHFKVVVVSTKFAGISLVARHRLLNNLLKDELQTGVHALSLLPYTPEQWQVQQVAGVPASPSCKGGSKAPAGPGASSPS